jgi:hypothetical protein
MLREQVAVERIIRIAEERLLASVATLRDMVRQSRKNGARQTSHAGEALTGALRSQSVHFHRNLSPEPDLSPKTSPGRTAILLAIWFGTPHGSQPCVLHCC